MTIEKPEPTPTAAAEIMRARAVAAEWHKGQVRKGACAEPYITHLLEVAALVAEAEPADTELVIAALLHDAIEDQKKTHQEIAALFGERAADLVAEVTDNKALLKAERKRLQVENAAHKSPAAKVIKLADKTSNLRSLALSPPVDWDTARRRQYIEWASQVVEGLRGASPLLEARFDEARELAVRSIGGAEA